MQFDEKNKISHIFAKNDFDLYLAQGFLMASDRLWQMDFIYRTGAGKLEEVVGDGVP